ncbi:MAG: MBL fold metallo-hydrolase [Planctomycetaceae bacterium]|jgi:glyoxylase-like metal-dependent hydrolase (beta-lactamase superfamily II)|nr:MBL fold metallo-hydrolase [Planctomycetaceae bacterium]
MSSSTEIEYDPYQHVVRFETDAGRRIYRIRCDTLRPLPGYSYLILGKPDDSSNNREHDFDKHSAILADCGTGENGCDRELLSGLELVRTMYKEDFQPTDIGRLVVTHAHIDHGGGGKQFLELTGAEAWCHKYDAGVFERYDERAAVGNRRFDEFLQHAGVELERRREIIEAFGFIRGRGKPYSISRRLKDGEQFDGITVCHTPGHSPGHICLFVDSSHIILGDHILARTITQIWPEQIAPHTGYIHYRDSLGKIEKIAEGKIGLPGHEQIILDLPMRIDIIRKSHQRRMERILDVLQNSREPMSIAQIARKMYLSQSGVWTLLALTDVGARIEYLEQIGLISIANFDELELGKSDVFLYTNV